MTSHATTVACGGAPTQDAYWMRRALSLAAQALGVSNPNPAVGCVLVSAQGQLLAQGHTQAYGGRHAEAQALFEAQQQGLSLRGATAYVTLEPCSHVGRTPPCADALLAAGIARVVACWQDPNPQVAGQGFARLRAAGVQVDEGLFAHEAWQLNIGFFSRMVRQRPWVRLKVASSLDGFMALPNGQSQWLTGAAARADGHRYRARACAVLTGVGTVLADDPLLNARPESGAPARQPHLLIADRRLRTPDTAKLWQTLGQGGRQIHVFAQAPSESAAQRLAALGAQVHAMPQADAQGLIAALKLPTTPAPLALNELHVESGPRLGSALLHAGVVDEVLWYQAPLLLGAGQSAFAPPAGAPLARIAEALRLHLHTSETLGGDLKLVLHTRQGQHFWQQGGKTQNNAEF